MVRMARHPSHTALSLALSHTRTYSPTLTNAAWRWQAARLPADAEEWVEEEDVYLDEPFDEEAPSPVGVRGSPLAHLSLSLSHTHTQTHAHTHTHTTVWA